MSLNVVVWTAKQFDLSDFPICSENIFVLTTQKSAEHSLLLKIDIHCVCWCWWEHSEFVCSFSTHSYQIIFEGARWENREVSKVGLHAETEKTMPTISFRKPVRLLILLQIVTAEERQKKNKPLLHVKHMKIPFCTEISNYGMKPFQTLWESRDKSFQLA